MNIWHDISPERIKVDDFIVYIEISKGSKLKYELDKETGLLILDRVLKTSMQYPVNYGFVPRTLSIDGDPLDVFVLGNDAIQSGSLVRCYPIGVIKLLDDGDYDEKILAIPCHNVQFNSYKDVSDLPAHICPEIEHFLSQYKANDDKTVVRGKTSGLTSARRYIREAISRYNQEILFKQTFDKSEIENCSKR